MVPRRLGVQSSVYKYMEKNVINPLIGDNDAIFWEIKIQVKLKECHTNLLLAFIIIHFPNLLSVIC